MSSVSPLGLFAMSFIFLGCGIALQLKGVNGGSFFFLLDRSPLQFHRRFGQLAWQIGRSAIGAFTN